MRLKVNIRSPVVPPYDTKISKFLTSPKLLQKDITEKLFSNATEWCKFELHSMFQWADMSITHIGMVKVVTCHMLLYTLCT